MLDGLTHTHDADVDVMLVGPEGQCAIVQSEVGDHDLVTDIDLILDDEATSSLPIEAPLTSGTYKPINADNHLPDGPDIFPPPAPTTCENSDLSVFDGTELKGDWKLYVFDNYTGDVGQYEGGWSLEITKQK